MAVNSGIFVEFMGYGIFGQKIAGIRDIKIPNNGASLFFRLTDRERAVVISSLVFLLQESLPDRFFQSPNPSLKVKWPIPKGGLQVGNKWL